MLNQSYAEISAKLQSYLKADPFFAAVYRYVEQRFDTAEHLTAHNWEHARRDTFNAIVIGEAEGADMTVVLPAIVMHDIGFLYGATGKTHGAVGADKLPMFLREGNIDATGRDIEHIAACLLTHKGDMHGETPATLEAKVVSDADMLEKFGPIGVYQGVRTFTEFNYDIDAIIKRFAQTAELTLQTQTGRELAKAGTDFVVRFGEDLADAYHAYREEQA